LTDKIKKIQIVGLSGVGKTYLSKVLDKKFGFYHISLDDIKYIKKFYSKRSLKERLKILEKEMKRKKFVIDGCWIDLPYEFYRQIDLIIIIKLSIFKMILNVFLRFLGNKNREYNFKYLIKDIKLILKSKFNKRLKKNIEKHNDFIMKNSKKFIILKSRLDFRKVEMDLNI
jgi:adenylate kinase family enzyme